MPSPTQDEPEQMCSISQIFASCLTGWHCSNSELLPRCKSIHLGWQDDLTHQQLGGRISETLSGKQIPILGHLPNSGQCLSRASLAHQMHHFYKMTCLWLLSSQTSSSVKLTFAQKHIHTTSHSCDSCPWSHFQSLAGSHIVGLTTQKRKPSTQAGNWSQISGNEQHA